MHARRGHLQLIGTTVQNGDGSQPIERAFFDVPRFLGDDENSIVTDTNRVPMQGFIAAQQGKHASWFNVRVDRPDFDQWLKKQIGPARRRGPTPKWNWEAARLVCWELLDHHGEPDPNDPALPNKAALERRIEAHFELNNRGEAPVESQIREYVTQWLDDYSAAKTGR